MTFKFENLEVWKLAREISGYIYDITSKFPKHEQFGITSQLRRASLSVCLNIAEGCDKDSDKEFIRFLRIAHASSLEVISGCYIAKDLSYLTDTEFKHIYSRVRNIAQKKQALIKYLQKSKV